MKQNCRIGRIWKILHLLHIEDIEIRVLYFECGSEVKNESLSKEEAEKIIKSPDYTYKPVKGMNWGRYVKNN